MDAVGLVPVSNANPLEFRGDLTHVQDIVCLLEYFNGTVPPLDFIMRGSTKHHV